MLGHLILARAYVQSERIDLVSAGERACALDELKRRFRRALHQVSLGVL